MFVARTDASSLHPNVIFSCVRLSASERTISSSRLTTAVPSGGVYDMPQEVSLEVNIDISPYSECLSWTDPDDDIETYYTTDNSIPTPISQLYTVPILIDHDTILQFFPISGDCTEEVLHIESYTINE